MIADHIIDHIIVSSLSWLIGMALGVVLGYAIGSLSLRIYAPRTPPDLLSAFFPWRTIVAGLFVLNLFPYIPSQHFGLGKDTGIISTAFLIMLCAVVLTIQTIRFTAVPLILRSISWSRSLAVFAVVIATHYSFWVGGGLGQDIQIYIGMLAEEEALAVGWWIVGIAFMFDFILGVLEFVLSSKIIAGLSRVQSEAG